MNLSIKTVSIFAKEIVIGWSKGAPSFVALRTLRLACPCAGCSGEKDALGNFYVGHSSALKSESFEVVSYELVGLYALRLFWKDGHSDGLYTFKHLMSLDEK